LGLPLPLHALTPKLVDYTIDKLPAHYTPIHQAMAIDMVMATNIPVVALTGREKLQNQTCQF